MDTEFTPCLDSYLPSLMGSLTGPDAELREVQDDIVDIMGPLGTAHDHWKPSTQFLHIHCWGLLASSFAMKCKCMDNVTALTFINRWGEPLSVSATCGNGAY